MARITKPVEVRKQEIIDTARAMFMEDGFDKTQMADISKKMNVASGTIYYYFKSKTELLYAVIDELADEKMQKKRQLLSGMQGSAFDLLKFIFAPLENGTAYEELRNIFADDPAIIQYYLTKMSNSTMPLLVSLIKQGNVDGSWSCEYPKETAVFISQGMAGVMSGEQDHKESSQEKSKRIKEYTNMIFRVLDTVKAP